jgi:hypothetical protein
VPPVADAPPVLDFPPVADAPPVLDFPPVADAPPVLAAPPEAVASLFVDRVVETPPAEFVAPPFS